MKINQLRSLQHSQTL